MKISVLILFIGIFSISAKSYSQEAKISLEVENATVNEVFDMIRAQTSYSFWFDLNNVDIARKVSIKVVDESVKDVLSKILKGQDLDVRINGNHIVIAPQNSFLTETPLQEKKLINGIVTDEHGRPVIGANIVEKGTKNGVMTNVDGKFSLSVLGNATLQVSYIGYIAQELRVGNQTLLSIILREDSQRLEEVVVVGYGTQKKVNLTGSVATIKSEDIVQNITSNLSNVLSGRLAGVFSRSPAGNPGSGSEILIRGMSTYNNNSPLTIVDGIERDYSNLDPNEIASISILKDAAASAVYGSRAANGVILVTTKRGSIGKPVLNYIGSVGIQMPGTYPELMSAYEYAITKNKAAMNMGYDQSNPAHMGQFISESELEKYRTGTKGVDWWNMIMKKTSLQTHHNLNINGGREEVKYFFSGGYMNQEGMYDNISFERYNFRSNVDARILDGLTAQINLDGRVENKKSPGYDPGTIFLYLTTHPLQYAFTKDGKPVYAGGGNPYEMVHNSGYTRNQTSVLQATGTLSYDAPFLEGLNAKILYSMGKHFSFDKNFLKPHELFLVDENNENVLSSKMFGSQTSLTEGASSMKNYNLNVSLNYNNTFNEKHNVSALALYEQMEEWGNNFWASRINYISNAVDQLFAGGDEDKNNDGKAYETARQSVVGRVSYNYAQKYYFETSIRYDGSVIFAPDYRWGVFPSFSGGWRISEEKFIKGNSQLKFIDNLKLRASYGILGNDRISAYQYLNYYVFAQGGIFDGEITQGIRSSSFANESLTWEKAKTLDVGLEGQLWNGLLSFEIDYFYKRTSDILAKKNTSVPGTFGTVLPDENYAIVDNKGIDLMFRHANKVRNVNYYASATLSYARDKVIKIDDPVNQKDYLIRTGRPMWSVAGYKSDGLFQSDEEAENYMLQFNAIPKAGDIKYVDINEDGKIDEDDQTIVSKYNGAPDLMFGFNAGLEWKGLEINAQFQGASNFIFIYDERGKIMFYGTGNTFKYLMDGWSPDNPDAKYPRVWMDTHPNNSKYSDFWMRNPAYLKLRNLEIAYNVPSHLLQFLCIDKLRVFMTGTNLFTLKGDMEFEPEARGPHYYPEQRSFNFGLNVSF